MPETLPAHRSASAGWPLGLAGFVLLIVGTTAMSGVVAAAYGQSHAAWTWTMRLGLAGSLLASAAAQVLILTGGWLIWRSRRGR